IKNYFASKTPREKILVLALVWTALFIWFSSAAKRQKSSSLAYGSLESKIQAANIAIAQTSAAESKLQEARAGVDQSKTIADLRVEVEKLLNSGGFSNFSMSFAPDQIMPQMEVRTVSLSLQRDTLSHFIAFEQSVLARAPYMFFKSAEFTADSKGQLSARYEISSFDFKK
ncbi:MAG: hypothetical protein J6T16_04880, partial [Opitutales bacterium]|nr:hypothetical protein [Opitutales bacterium]